MDSDELQNREQSAGLTEQNDGRSPSPERSTAVSFSPEAERRRMIDGLNREIKQSVPPLTVRMKSWSLTD
jgi:hypothetical protein